MRSHASKLAALTGTVLLYGLVSPAAAQMTDSACHRLGALAEEMIGGLLPRVEQTTLPPFHLTDGVCLAQDIELVLPSAVIVIDELAVEIDGLDAALNTGAVPSRVAVNVRGLRAIGQPGAPVIDYLFRAQANAYDPIAVDFLVTHAEGEVTLEQFEIEFPGDNRFEATMRLSEFDPATPTSSRIEAATLDLQTNGLFETYALMPLGQMLLSESDTPMEVQVMALKAMAQAQIATLPDPLFPQDSRAALSEIVSDMPNPAGWLSVALDSETGISLEPLMAMLGGVGLGDPLAPFADSVFTISYTRPEEG